MDPAPVSVLVVDDEADALATVALCLRAAGYDVTTARDGREAARLIDGRTFDLVITDLLMPQVDGIELLTHVKATRPGLPVIAVSGGADYFGDSNLLEVAVKMGARFTLVKPFSPRQLLNAVTAVCPRQPAGKNPA